MKFPGNILDMSGKLPRTFWEYSGKIAGTLRENSGQLPGTFREHSGNILGNFWNTNPGIFPEFSRTFPGIVQDNFRNCSRKNSGNFLDSRPEFFREISGKSQKISGMFPIIPEMSGKCPGKNPEILFFLRFSCDFLFNFPGKNSRKV